MEENKKHTWLKYCAVGILAFIICFLAFYCVMEIMMNRISDPMYHAKQMDKIIKQQERELRNFERSMEVNPFEPKLATSFVEMSKEGDAYKIKVNLKPFGGDEKIIKTEFDDNLITISGEQEKQKRGKESIVKFSQSYYLNDKIKKDKISKEKVGNKYIITVPTD